MIQGVTIRAEILEDIPQRVLVRWSACYCENAFTYSGITSDDFDASFRDAIQSILDWSENPTRRRARLAVRRASKVSLRYSTASEELTWSVLKLAESLRQGPFAPLSPAEMASQVAWTCQQNSAYCTDDWGIWQLAKLLGYEFDSDIEFEVLMSMLEDWTLPVTELLQVIPAMVA